MERERERERERVGHQLGYNEGLIAKQGLLGHIIKKLAGEART
jgi:hypothetical protein